MIHIDLKPISINSAYRGRRFATKDLIQYKKVLSRILPRMIVPEGKLAVWYTFGVSAATDGDNLIKAFQDIIAEKYGFNDKRIYEWHVKKIDRKKGYEFIEFAIKNEKIYK